MIKNEFGRKTLTVILFVVFIILPLVSRADSDQTMKNSVDTFLSEELRRAKSPFYSTTPKAEVFIGSESLNVELLVKIINARINEFGMIALQDSVKKIKKENSKLDLATEDLLDTAEQQLFSEYRSQLSTDKIVKALARYATTIAFDYLIPAEKYSSETLKSEKNIDSQICRRDLVRVVLSELANSPDHFAVYWSEQEGKPEQRQKQHVNFLAQIDFPVREDQDVCKKIMIDGKRYYQFNEDDKKTVRDTVIPIIQLVSMIAWIRDHYDETTYKEIQKLLEKYNYKDARNQAIIKIVLLQLMKIYDAQKSNDDKKTFEAMHALISASADLLFEEKCIVGDENCSADEKKCRSEKRKCKLYKDLALSVIDNITYDDVNKKLQFSVEKAITPLATQFNQLGYGGKSKYFFHFVIGSGMAYVTKSADAADEKKWLPLVSEQIGFGTKFWISDNEKIVAKLGVYASGLLYRTLFNNIESKGVIVGPFFAVDLYKTIQLNISPYYWNFIPADSGTRSRVDHGLSFGVYIPLGDYLGELFSSNSNNK